MKKWRWIFLLMIIVSCNRRSYINHPLIVTDINNKIDTVYYMIPKNYHFAIEKDYHFNKNWLVAIPHGTEGIEERSWKWLKRDIIDYKLLNKKP